MTNAVGMKLESSTNIKASRGSRVRQEKGKRRTEEQLGPGKGGHVSSEDDDANVKDVARSRRPGPHSVPRTRGFAARQPRRALSQ